MSRPWRSEIRLHLAPGACSGWVYRPFARGPRVVARVEGRPSESLPALAEQLRAQETTAARRWRARPVQMTLADEFVYYALLPATMPWARHETDARNHIESMLGLHDIAVQASLLPGGRHWLAAAVEKQRIAQWRQALRSAGLTLAGLRPALLEDLRRIAPRIEAPGSIVALLRNEGAVLLKLRDGVPAALAWERFDTRSPELVARRIRAFSLVHGDKGVAAAPVCLAARPARVDAAMQARARAEGWSLLALGSAAVAMEAAS